MALLCLPANQPSVPEGTTTGRLGPHITRRRHHSAGTRWTTAQVARRFLCSVLGLFPSPQISIPIKLAKLPTHPPLLLSLHTHHAATLQRLAGTWMEKDGLAPRSLPPQQSSRPKGIHLKLGPDGRPDWSCASPWAVIGLVASCSGKSYPESTWG